MEENVTIYTYFLSGWSTGINKVQTFLGNLFTLIIYIDIGYILVSIKLPQPPWYPFKFDT
jgi:hypothetical protein